MNLRHIQTFVTVAEQGTVLKAALRLLITQPALSRQISNLEAELGVRLFDRIRRRLILTGDGERLLADCRNILGAVDTLSARAQLLRNPEAGFLRVAATPQTIDGVFSTFLHRYSARFPNVQIKLSESVGPADLFVRLEQGELHLGVGLLRSMQDQNHEFGSFPLPSIEFLAAGHASRPLGSAGNIEVASLAAYPLLLMASSFEVRKSFDRACRLAGLKPQIYMESRTPHTLLALAEAGHGVAIVPSVLPVHRYRLRVARLMHGRKPLREPLTVAWDRRRVLPQYAKAFCEMLDTYMREVFPISQPLARSALRATKRVSKRRG